MKDEQLELLALIQQNAWEIQDAVRRILAAEIITPWSFPFGSEKFPVPKWYVACRHDETGKLNGGYPHTGLDFNVNVSPYGDVDRGQPVYAVANGTVYAAGYSTSYLGGIVLQVEHEGKLLYVRYWHLENDAVFQSWKAGHSVGKAECLGHIGNYKLGDGGDHLHFDMRDRPFEPHWWFTNHPGGWLDPVPPLRWHLDAALLEAVLSARRT